MQTRANSGALATSALRPAAALVLLLAAALLAVSHPADAGTWRIGRSQGDCPGGCHFYDNPPTIPAGGAIPAAMASPSVIAGDTLVVYPGTFTQRFEMKSNITLLSFSGPDVTFLQGQHGTLPMTTWSGSGPATTIDGFTVKWSSGDFGTGGAFAFYAASGTIRNCIIKECRAGLGAAAYSQFSDVVLENNAFYNNFSTAGGGTLAITAGAPTVRGNTFIGSGSPPGYQGAALYASGYTDLLFERNIVTLSTGGSAVYCAGLNTNTLECNLVWDNAAGSFGGTCVDSSGASGNIAVDPYLCNPGAGNFAVCADSPALSAACGPIGYQAPGGACAPCGPTPVAQLETSSWGLVKVRYR